MRKNIVFIGIFLLSIICLAGCASKKEETATPVEQYYYECDLELERVMPGYINYDFLLTSNWAMEYASYENSSATGYDYAINITYSNGECNRFTRNCGPGEAVLGIGYVVGCEDFLLIEGNCEMSDRPAKWSVVTYDKQGNKKSEQDITAVLKDCSVMMLCEIAQNSSDEFHISISDYATNKVDYKVLSGDGTEKYSSAFFDCRFEKFLTTAEEQIAFEINDGTSDPAILANDSKVHRVYVYDESIGKEREVYSFDEKYNEDECIKAVSFFDSERLVFVTGNGIYFSDYSLNNVVQINSFDTQAFITSPDTLDIVCDNAGGYWLVMERISNGIKTCLQHYVQLSPVYARMKDALLAVHVNQCDETPVEVVNDGRSAGSKSYMWVHITGELSTGPKVVLYEYQKTRSSDHPKAFYKDFKGILVTDGLEQYHKTARETEGLVNANCWTHARRDYVNAIKAMNKDNPEAIKRSTAYQALARIGAIYKPEEGLKALSPKERLKERQSSIRPLVEEYFTWIKKVLFSVPPKSKTADGIRYSINQEEYLRVFLTDGEVAIDNSASERALRDFTIGRKNWVTINTPRGAEASAVIYSITQTAKLNGLNVYYYIKYLLEQLVLLKDEDGNIEQSALEPLMPWSKTLPADCYSKRRQ